MNSDKNRYAGFLNSVKVTRSPDVSSGFEQALGLNWENRISAEQKITFSQAEQ